MNPRLPTAPGCAGRPLAAARQGLPRRPLCLRLSGARRQAGFTLVEAVVAMAVLVVVVSVALPSMGEFSASNQVSAARANFSATMALARTEAAKRGVAVLVQAEAGGPSGNEFANGWAVVVDADGNGQAGASELRIRKVAALPSGVRLSGQTTLGFQPTGALAGASDVVYTLCRTQGSARGYSVTLTPSGLADVASLASC